MTAAPDKLQGKRLPDNVRRKYAEPGDFWRERDLTRTGWHWAICDPAGNWGTLGGYQVYEHDDRMISVQGVLVDRESGDRWRLVNGVWERDRFEVQAA